ncbi:MAG: flagellar export protein FliJ [Burkholderiaceae bacterium]
MSKISALDTLIDLATTATDEAAKRLGLAIRAGEEAQSKLNMLLQYREDYAARFQASLSAGMSPSDYRNFQLFMQKLDTAISGQEQVLAAAQRRIAQEQAAWRESERKRISFGTLASRAEEEKLRMDDKRLQKAMDEHAARQFFYKKTA